MKEKTNTLNEKANGGFFKLKQNGTNVKTEIIAGLTTFFAMAYIIAVNPNILSEAGMEWGAVFLATIISSIIGTLVMGLVANVPYAQAPGMGLNAFFVYTVCFTLGFTWQQALTMVFVCGIINVIITITKLRKAIIKAIPKSLQLAIGGGIGIFIAYIGICNIGFVNFGAGVPALSAVSTLPLVIFVFGLILTVVLMLFKVKGAILIGIIGTTIVSMIANKIAGNPIVGNMVGFKECAAALPTTFGVIFTDAGFGSLFTGGIDKIFIVLVTIFSFSITDTFDTIGTFIGTGRASGIFSEDDDKAMENASGFKSKMDKALFADATATSIGAIFGTSNTTTYVESAAGINAGGRTGLTSVVVAICFVISAFLAKFISAIPTAATAPALIIVGIQMLAAFREIKWDELKEAIPAFFAGIFMALTYSISDGIATGFIFYVIVKCCTKGIKEIHPILWVSTGLFLLNYILKAVAY